MSNFGRAWTKRSSFPRRKKTKPLQRSSSPPQIQSQLFCGACVQLPGNPLNAAFSQLLQFDKGRHVTTVCGCVQTNICSYTIYCIQYTVYTIENSELSENSDEQMFFLECTLPRKLIIGRVEEEKIYYIWCIK